MIAGWMLYTLVVAALCGLMGAAAERLLRTLGRPLRWAWVGAVLLSVVLPLLLASGGGGSAVTAAAGTVSSSAWEEPVRRVLALGPVDRGGIVFLDRTLLLLWATGSLLLLALLLSASLRLRRERRGWPRCVVAGVPVLVSSRRGPAVAGFLRPPIVVPNRVLDWEPPLQRLVIAHEREHVRAADPLLGLGALLALVLVPWNLPLWWQVSRLRAAIELDCDARVVDGSPHRRRYGELLLRVGSGEAGWLGGMALAEGDASLERRIRALAQPRPRADLLTVALLGAGLLVVPVLHAIPAPPRPDPVHLVGTSRGLLPERPGGAASPDSPRSIPDPPPAGPAGLTLPGTPSESHLRDAIRRHHPTVSSGGLSPDRAVWFIVDENGRPVRTGIAEGTNEQILGRLRSAHPALVSDYLLVFEHVIFRDETVRVLWSIPEPTEPVPE